MTGLTSGSLGIIGGIGPESTIVYYRSVLSAYATSHPGAPPPSVLINSIDVTKVLALAAQNPSELTTYLLHEIERLTFAGATLALLAANTPHIVFDDVAARATIPLVSIVDAASAELVRRGLKRVGLIGTRFTMSGGFYQKAATTHGIDIVVPAQEDQAYVHDKYVNELLRNVFTPQTHDGLVGVIDRLREQEGIEGVILGGTELPLILTEPVVNGIPLLDTTQIHAAAAVERLWGEVGASSLPEMSF